MQLISVDGGTTNTRLVLIRDGEILAGQRLSLGLRDQLSGEGKTYREVLAEGIRKLLSENGLTEKQIDAVTVSGMICSERGLSEVPHIPSPVNVKGLAAAMRKTSFPEIADLPFYLIPGVKTFSGDGDRIYFDTEG